MKKATHSGEHDLKELLKSLNPHHNPGEFVFCVVADPGRIESGEIVMSFREEEGVSVILRKEVAERLALPYAGVWSWITLRVYSSLQAVGLTAAFSNALAKNGISCNVVAAYYHDHLFVEKHHTEAAITILTELAKPAQQNDAV